MKSPDDKAELFARFRKMVIDGFMRGGEDDPDFIEGNIGLVELLEGDKGTCVRCGASLRGRHIHVRNKLNGTNKRTGNDSCTS